MGLEGNNEFGVNVGLDEGVVNLWGDYEVIMLYVGHASGFFNGGRGEDFVDERNLME